MVFVARTCRQRCCDIPRKMVSFPLTAWRSAYAYYRRRPLIGTRWGPSFRKFLGDAIVRIDNSLLASGAGAKSASGAIVSCGVAIGSFFAGLGDLKGE